MWKGKRKFYIVPVQKYNNRQYFYHSSLVWQVSNYIKYLLAGNDLIVLHNSMMFYKMGVEVLAIPLKIIKLLFDIIIFKKKIKRIICLTLSVLNNIDHVVLVKWTTQSQKVHLENKIIKFKQLKGRLQDYSHNIYIRLT